MILLDTNVVSETMSLTPNLKVMTWIDEWDAEHVFISTMTVAELLFGLELMVEGVRKSTLTQLMNKQFDYFENRILPFDLESAQRFAGSMTECRKLGRPMSPQDGVIAAIALANNLDLVTRNVKDFEGISGLNVVNPWL